MRAVVILAVTLLIVPAFALAQNPMSQDWKSLPDTDALSFKKPPAPKVHLVPTQYATIQQAVDASLSGDTVLVGTGYYVENVDLRFKNITIRSDVDLDWQTHDIAPLNTIIDGSNTASVVRLKGNSRLTVVEGFTLTNGKGTQLIFGKVGGGIYGELSSPRILSNIIAGNNVPVGGGGIYCSGDAGPEVKDCIVYNNSAGQYAGGLYVGGEHCVVENCMVIRNTAGNGAGMMCFNGEPLVLNTTVAGNTAASYGGGIVFQLCDSATVVNTILWNSAPSAPELHITTFFGVPSEVNISYSDVQGGAAAATLGVDCTLNWGAGMLEIDPLFVNPGTGDFHLSGLSPCIDTGDNAFPGLPDYDFEGDDRILDGDGDLVDVVDMGADEYVL
jgi:hypothetical protein